MASWSDSWDYEFKREVDGEAFAEVDIAGQGYERHAYGSPAWTTGKFTLWVHQGTGLVTTDPSGLVEWMHSLRTQVS